MDRTTLARKLREALFDHIETGRREALQDSAIDALFESVLALQKLQTVPEANSVTGTVSIAASSGGVNLYNTAGPTFANTTTAPGTWGHSHAITMANMPTHTHSYSAPTSQCRPDTTNCGICWANPAIGDVNLDTMSIYGYKNGTAQWVSIHEPDFAKALADAQTIFVS